MDERERQLGIIIGLSVAVYGLALLFANKWDVTLGVGLAFLGFVAVAGIGAVVALRRAKRLDRLHQRPAVGTVAGTPRSSADDRERAIQRVVDLGTAVMIILGPAILLGGIFIDAPGQAGRIVLGGLATLISIASIARDRGRPEEPTRVAEYWWLGVALPFATGAWGTFLYLGFRIRRQRPVLWAAASVYFTGFASAIALNVAAHDSGSLSDLAAILLALTWVVSIVHAITIRRTVRRQLNAVPAG